MQIEDSVIEIAETVKELVRIIKCFPNYDKLDPTFEKRLNDAYIKASRAKERAEAVKQKPL